MRVLIAGCYHRHDSTHVATDLARSVLAAGGDVALQSLAAGPALVWAPWRRRLCSALTGPDDHGWLRRADILFYVDHPGGEHLLRARALGVRQVFVPPWSRLEADWKDEYALYDFVIASHPALAELLRAEYPLAAPPVYCPWDVGDRIARDEGVGGRPHVLVTVEDPGMESVPMTFMAGVVQLMNEVRDCRVTVLFRRPPLAIRRFARRLLDVAGFDGARLRLAPMQYGAELRRTIAAADLVVYPAAFSDHAIVPLVAAACGTPVVCFDCPPMSGVASGLAVPCKTTRTLSGLQYVTVYDPAELFAGAVRILRGMPPEPARLSWEERRRTFFGTIQQLCLS